MKKQGFVELLYILLAFFACFIFQVEGIFVANIVFVVFFLTHCQEIRINKKALICFGVFWMVVLVSTVAFSQQVGFNLRNVVQMVFNLQYLFLFTDFTYDRKKMETCYFRFSLVLAVWILLTFLCTGTAFSYNLIQIQIQPAGRMWGDICTPGWPNVTVLPLVYGVYLALFSMDMPPKKRYWAVGILCAAMYLTTSRSGFLGAGLIIGYYLFGLFVKMSKRHKKQLLIALGVCVLAAAIVLLLDENLARRLFFTGDRQNIATICLGYLKERPLLGYGGNTLDVLMELYPTDIAMMEWGHTHNTLLELLIRYGILGAGAFLLMLWFVFRDLGTREGKFLFLMFWFLSLFQIYFRSFVFLLIVILVLKKHRKETEESNMITISVGKIINKLVRREKK